MREEVILIDEQDRELGSAEKLVAHRTGKLHRAVSVFVFDDAGNLLLQRRASTKYHSPDRWSNTCCGHPRPGETPQAAAHRRLREEMGFDCVLEPAFAFLYRAELENGLQEHEFDRVFVGRFAGVPSPNPAEVGAWRWANVEEIIADQAVHPDRYTVWFKLILREHRQKLVTPSTNRAHSQ
jgi:isopentenyl-diphosphate delta-isomerase